MTEGDQNADRQVHAASPIHERLVILFMAVLCGAIVALLLVDDAGATVLGYPVGDAVLALGIVQIAVGVPLILWQQWRAWSGRREIRRFERGETGEVALD